MLFNSIGFLTFFSVLVPTYYVISHKFRWVVLLTASLVFASALGRNYLLLLMAVSVATCVAGGLLGTAHSGQSLADHRRRKTILISGLIVVLGTLVLFKYYDFLAASLEALIANLGVAREPPLLPRLELPVAAGLSFYTLSCVSYLVDVYRGHLQPERHVGRFVLYVAFFPKLLAGPIERAKPFLTQVRAPVSFNAAGVTAGLQLMLWGLFKKVVIADRLAMVVDAAYQQPSFAPAADLVIATYFFAFQLYCDFSGYSDIAIGAAKVLGFDLMENFRRPYLSTSAGEFWGRRWHVSLATWFRDYLYIPMGGNRVPRLRRALNVMAVFLASGLWHGANWTFVAWGGLNGLYQVASRDAKVTGPTSQVDKPRGEAGGLRPRVSAVTRVLVTFHLILITWVFFRAASLADATTILSRTAASAVRLPALLVARLASAELLLSLALIAVLLAVELLDERKPVWERLRARPVFIRWAVYYVMLFGLIVLGRWNLRQFVYMQF